MRKILVVALVALIALTGCTGNQPAPNPTYYVPPITLPPTTPTPGVPTFALVCTPPTQAVMTWLRDKLWTPDMPESDVTMVDVGNGNNFGSDWWVVAARVYDGPNQYYASWLMDEPSEQWISIYMGSISNNTDWGKVSWTGDRLDRGKAAQAKAISCLPNA